MYWSILLHILMMFKATDYFNEIVTQFYFPKIGKSLYIQKLCFCLQATHLRVCEIQLLKGDLDHDFNRSTKASMKSFESYRQLVILF